MADWLFFFCCRGCLRGDEDPDALYNVLGVSRRASAEEIRKAYRKLSLNVHPDKILQRGGARPTKEQVEEFARLKDAYETLSDPRKRKIYDEVGETGLNVLNGTFAHDPGILARNFKRSSTADRSRLLAVVGACVAVVLIAPILAAVRADGEVSGISWVGLWTPFWIFDALMLLATAMSLAEGVRKAAKGAKAAKAGKAKEDDGDAERGATDEDRDRKNGDDNDDDEDDDHVPMGERLRAALVVVLVVLLQLFVMLKLDGYLVSAWSWAAVLAPWLALELLALPEKLLKSFKPAPIAFSDVVLSAQTPTADDEEMRQQEEESRRAMAFVEAYGERVGAQQDLGVALLRLMFYALLVTKLDDSSASFSWLIVFLPLLVYFPYSFGFAIALRSKGSGLLAEVVGQHGISGEGVTAEEVEALMPLLTPEQRAKVAISELYVSLAASSCCAAFALSIPAALLIARVTTADSSDSSGDSSTHSFASIYVILPFLIVAGCAYCLLACFVCCFREGVDGEGADAEGGIGVTGSASTSSPPAAGAPAAGGAPNYGSTGVSPTASSSERPSGSTTTPLLSASMLPERPSPEAVEPASSASAVTAQPQDQPDID